MKKLILVLAIALMASPTFALTVALSRVGSSTTVDVTYTDACSTNLPRAFAMDVTITSPGLIANVVNYKTNGESTSASRGYGIYPARIDINTGGVVQGWGTPLADGNDPGMTSGIGIGHNRVFLEFASLYYNKDVNAPATSGTLCSLIINPGTASSPLNIRAIGETTYRGGVVLENGDTFALDVNTLYTVAASLPGKATSPSPADSATGVIRTGTSLTWVAGAGATSHDVYFGTAVSPPSIGNQTGTSYTPTGTMVQSKTYYWRIDEKNATGTTTGDIWRFTVQECLKSTVTEYSAWVAWGKPSCWCFQRQCRGDVNGGKSGYWVQLLDLNILKSAYQKSDTQLGTVTNGICADLNHSKSGYRVQLLDLNALKSYYQKNDTLTPVCNSSIVNFWAN
jgi:hypothetical protein